MAPVEIFQIIMTSRNVDAGISSVCDGKGRIEVEANPAQPSYLIRPSDRIQSIPIQVNSILSNQYLRFHPEISIRLKQLSFACTDKGCVLRSTPSKHLWQVVLPCPHTSRLLLPPFLIPINWDVQFTLQAKVGKSEMTQRSMRMVYERRRTLHVVSIHWDAIPNWPKKYRKE